MSVALAPNHDLIGIKGGFGRLSTPALVLDLDAMEANIQAMAAHCGRTGQALRPHAKSHKSVAIARRQIEAGAVGQCCATIREAEAMADAAVPGVLITSPPTGPAKTARLMALHAKAPDAMVVADHPDTVRALATAVADQGGGRMLRVLVDFDVGLARTGAADAASAAALAQAIDAAPQLRFAGVQAYYGQLQHVARFAERTDLVMAQAARVRELVDRLADQGLAPELVTGGGTGTHDIDHRAGVFNELQAGSYVFTDVDYNAVDLTADQPRPFAPALFVMATVVSVSHDSHAVIDAGLKSFATDGPAPVFGDGAPAGATYKFMGDEHGAVVYAGGENTRLKIGDAVRCVVPHCDPTVNLYDHYHCYRDDTLVDIWPVDGRGNP